MQFKLSLPLFTDVTSVLRLSQEITGSDGPDSFVSQEGNDTYDGKGGFDTLSYGAHPVAVQVFLDLGKARSDAGVDQLISIERINGSAQADYIKGADGFDNRLFGGGGDDRIIAGLGTSEINGGGGDDRITGTAASDNELTGGRGNDIIFGLAGDDWIRGNEGADIMFGGRGDDILIGEDGADRLRGNLGNDSVNGDAGSDRLFGGGGNDALFGDADRDYLLGENGNDYLDGGDGDDVLTGGAGRDQFAFSDFDAGYDRIRDFEAGFDSLAFINTQMTAEDILATASDRASGVRLSVDDHIILLEGVAASELSVSDIEFFTF